MFSYTFLFVYVQPDEYGIKVVRVGLTRGVQEADLPCRADLYPALWAAADISSAQRHPGVGTDQLSRKQQPEGARKDRAAHIQTSDGFFVDVDVSILYHIKDPYMVFTTIGPGKLYEDNGIIPKAEPALKGDSGETHH